MQLATSPFSGNVSSSDVDLAKALKAARHDYEAWEKVTTVEVHGCPVHLHRNALEGGLYEYYAFGTLPIAAEELVDMNW
jgi:hypothetical protein